MKVYYVTEGHTHFFASLAEAKKAARESALTSDLDVEVERLDVRTDQTGLVAALNGACGRGPVVYTARKRNDD